MSNRISTLPPEAVQAASDALDAFDAAIQPHAVELSADDRRELLKLGDKSLAFVEKAVRYGRERTDLVPGFLDVDEMATDLDAFRILEGLAERLLGLEALVRDTAMVAGSEANAGAHVLYRAVRAAADAGAPGADTVRDDLGERFARGSRSTPEPTDAAGDPGTATDADR